MLKHFHFGQMVSLFDYLPSWVWIHLLIYKISLLGSTSLSRVWSSRILGRCLHRSRRASFQAALLQEVASFPLKFKMSSNCEQIFFNTLYVKCLIWTLFSCQMGISLLFNWFVALRRIYRKNILIGIPIKFYHDYKTNKIQ